MEFNDALELFDKQINLASDINDKELEDDPYGNKGSVYMKLENYEQAICCAEKSLKIES